MKKFPGCSAAEALTAILLLGITAPALIGTLGGILIAELNVRERVHMLAAAEWWFARLPSPAGAVEINSAPVSDDAGVRFRWETKELEKGGVFVTLRVQGRVFGPEFVVSRIF